MGALKHGHPFLAWMKSVFVTAYEENLSLKEYKMTLAQQALEPLASKISVSTVPAHKNPVKNMLLMKRKRVAVRILRSYAARNSV